MLVTKKLKFISYCKMNRHALLLLSMLVVKLLLRSVRLLSILFFIHSCKTINLFLKALT